MTPFQFADALEVERALRLPAWPTLEELREYISRRAAGSISALPTSSQISTDECYYANCRSGLPPLPASLLEQWLAGAQLTGAVLSVPGTFETLRPSSSCLHCLASARF